MKKTTTILFSMLLAALVSTTVHAAFSSDADAFSAILSNKDLSGRAKLTLTGQLDKNMSKLEYFFSEVHNKSGKLLLSVKKVSDPEDAWKSLGVSCSKSDPLGMNFKCVINPSMITGSIGATSNINEMFERLQEYIIGVDISDDSFDYNLNSMMELDAAVKRDDVEDEESETSEPTGEASTAETPPAGNIAASYDDGVCSLSTSANPHVILTMLIGIAAIVSRRKTH